MAYNAAKDPSLLVKERADKFGRQGKLVVNNGTDFTSYAYLVVATAGTLVILPAGNADNGWLDFGTVPQGFMPPYLVRAVQAGSTAVCYTIED